MKSKDKAVEAIYIKNLEDKLYFEYTTDTTNMALTQNQNCYQNYKRFLCRWNFPLCTGRPESHHLDTTITVIDERQEEIKIIGTLPVCESLCTTYMTTCGYNADKCLTGFSDVFP